MNNLKNLSPYEQYCEGLKEGWELARMIRYDFTIETVIKMFGLKLADELSNPYHFISHYRNGMDAKKAYEEWKESFEIHLGDVVMTTEDDEEIRGIVLEFDDETVSVYDENGCIKVWDKGLVCKTNKHIEVTDWLMAGIRSAE